MPPRTVVARARQLASTPIDPAAAEAAMTAGFRVLASGAVLTGLVLVYSTSHLVIGLLGALPLLAKGAQVLAPRLINRFGASRLSRVAGLLERLAFVVAAVAGLARAPHAVAWMLGGLGVGTVCGAIYDVALTAVTTRLVTPREQGRFFAIRTRWLCAFSVIAAVLGGWLVDFAEAHGIVPTTARGLTLLAGLLPAMLAMIALRRFDRVAPAIAQVMSTASRSVTDPLGVRTTGELDVPRPAKRDPTLRAILVFAAAWGFSTGITARHIEVFALTEVGFSIGMLTIMTGLIAGAGFIGARTWGKLGDHFGAKPILLVAATAVALNPIWYALATRSHPWPFVVGQIVGGIANAGWLIGVPLLLLRAPVYGGNVRALALFQATIGISSGVAPLIGGALLDALDMLSAHSAYAVLFGLTAILRLASVRLLAVVPDAGSERMGRMAHVFWRAQTRYASARIAAAYRPHAAPEPATDPRAKHLRQTA